MKLKADALEAWELERFQNLKQQEVFQKEAKYKQSKQAELLALQKRVQTGREEQKKQRHMDLERWGPGRVCVRVADGGPRRTWDATKSLVHPVHASVYQPCHHACSRVGTAVSVSDWASRVTSWRPCVCVCARRQITPAVPERQV